MAIMIARHNARAGVRARLKIEILDFVTCFPRACHMHQNSTSKWLGGVFWQCETKKHCFGLIILRFYAFWTNITIFGEI